MRRLSKFGQSSQRYLLFDFQKADSTSRYRKPFQVKPFQLRKRMHFHFVIDPVSFEYYLLRR